MTAGPSKTSMSSLRHRCYSLRSFGIILIQNDPLSHISPALARSLLTLVLHEVPHVRKNSLASHKNSCLSINRVDLLQGEKDSQISLERRRAWASRKRFLSGKDHH